ncbi:FliM/FliN family flagellar motor switch protein [Spongiibacter taiwanensis]|uniref:flagellar motor switch protein FliM n=1 Tax=Spongiibacter taiwanensis TaxID=1748242 RepID=UPI002036020D|nr:FliM/FliN family flagellar motor switch protein [Spongiibacter taiwanensis]USA43818.1 FliM/FliN family flagellar motor switch protein [Spongiibacter taiwanensis]
MAGVLDPEELDALMDSAESAREGSSGKFDLSRQDFALQRLLPAVSQLCNQFAAGARETLLGLVPGVATVSLDEISSMPFGELKARLPAPCSAALYQGLPDGAGFLLAMESELVFQLVDRYYGGRGGAVPVREKLSVTEQSFTEQANGLLKDNLATAWKSLLAQPPSLIQQAWNMGAIEAFEDHDAMVACRFVVSFGLEGDNFGMWTALPWPALDALRDRLKDTPRAHNEGDAQWQQRLTKRLECAPLDLAAVLAETELSLKRVLAFKPGDIIDIAEADEVVIKLDGRPLFFGRLGSQQGNFAVRVEGRCPPEEE